ncbi:MAG: pseudouridylate synthase [Spirochaetes bacterium]|nr:pseudouridylate synthase [Spirochaetota bacterium]
MIQPRILHDDGEMVLIEKPMDYLIHPNKHDPGSPTCVDFLGSVLGQRIFVVHRLDRAVSGLMVFAKTPEAARALSDQFRDRAVDKTYVALVRGSVDESMTIDIPLETSPRSGERGQQVPAMTTVRPLATTSIDVAIGRYSEAWYSLVEVHLHTGRFHQARKHLHRVTHPIIGDRKHGDNKHNRFFRDHYGSRMIFLRAAELRFENPSRTAKVFARIGLPEEWMPILEDLQLSVPSDLRSGPEVDIY